VERKIVKDLVRILRAVPQLVRFPTKQLWIDYDEEADVLYLSFYKPQTANCATTASSFIAAAKKSSA
jgi:hypothetical protein